MRGCVKTLTAKWLKMVSLVLLVYADEINKAIVGAVKRYYDKWKKIINNGKKKINK